MLGHPQTHVRAHQVFQHESARELPLVYLEDGVGLGEPAAAGCAPVRGTLEVVLAMQAHLRRKHISHHHKAHLRTHASGSAKLLTVSMIRRSHKISTSRWHSEHSLTRVR